MNREHQHVQSDRTSATTRDDRPPTVRDHTAQTTRDDPSSTTRDAGATRRDDPRFASSVPATDFPLPDYLARDYEIVDDDLAPGGEADVAVIRHRETGALKVVKVYRRGITLPQSFVDGLASADPRHVLPVDRTTYTGWTSPRFVELMDYLPDGSLEDLLRRSGGSTPALAREVLVEMTDALAYIHDDLGIVHRDIKPANVLIKTREPLELVLADLGIAAEVAALRRSRRETSGGVKGTLIYQSPETLHLSDAGAPRDWWALGMTLCEVLTGQHPFKDGSGRILHDENRIRHAITMGAIDLSSVDDPRWNLLLSGLLAHRPEDRWGAEQVRRWLDGETPFVSTYRPTDTRERVVRPYRLGTGRFTDPVALADHMVAHWDDAVAVFTSPEDCRTLSAWIRDDVRDDSIDVNSLSPVSGGDRSRVDARIVEFTTHYRGAADLTFRGVRVGAADLATRYLRAGDDWERDPLLAALQPNVVAALAESQLDDAAGSRNQSEEYYALARLSRFAPLVDSVIDSARTEIASAAGQWIESTDVGAELRTALPARIIQARGIARATLLSPACLHDVRVQFDSLSGDGPAWFAALSARAAGSGRAVENNGAEADATEVGLKTLAIRVNDLAAHYDHACAAARQAAEQRSRAAAEAEAEAERQRAADRRQREVRSAFSTAWSRAFLLGGVWLFLCFIILANNFLGNPFLPGSYSMTTWTLLLSVIALLVVDLTVGTGRDGAFIGGGAIGFALATWYTASHMGRNAHYVDVSMFWLVGLLGVAGYLLTALARRSASTR